MAGCCLWHYIFKCGLVGVGWLVVACGTTSSSVGWLEWDGWLLSVVLHLQVCVGWSGMAGCCLWYYIFKCGLVGVGWLVVVCGTTSSSVCWLEWDGWLLPVVLHLQVCVGWSGMAGCCLWYYIFKCVLVGVGWLVVACGTTSSSVGWLEWDGWLLPVVLHLQVWVGWSGMAGCCLWYYIFKCVLVGVGWLVVACGTTSSSVGWLEWDGWLLPVALHLHVWVSWSGMAGCCLWYCIFKCGLVGVGWLVVACGTTSSSVGWLEWDGWLLPVVLHLQVWVGWSGMAGCCLWYYIFKCGLVGVGWLVVACGTTSSSVGWLEWDGWLLPVVLHLQVWVSLSGMAGCCLWYYIFKCGLVGVGWLVVACGTTSSCVG